MDWKNLPSRMEGGWKILHPNGGWMEGEWKVNGGWMEGGWRMDGGKMEGGWRIFLPILHPNLQPRALNTNTKK
jgi:hypothetical protein